MAAAHHRGVKSRSARVSSHRRSGESFRFEKRAIARHRRPTRLFDFVVSFDRDFDDADVKCSTRGGDVWAPAPVQNLVGEVTSPSTVRDADNKLAYIIALLKEVNRCTALHTCA